MIYIATDGIKSIFGELIVLGLYIYSPPANLLAFDKIDFNNLPLFREALKSDQEYISFSYRTIPPEALTADNRTVAFYTAVENIIEDILLFSNNLREDIPVRVHPHTPKSNPSYSYLASSASTHMRLACLLARFFRLPLLQRYHKDFSRYDLINNVGSLTYRHFSGIKLLGICQHHHPTVHLSVLKYVLSITRNAFLGPDTPFFSLTESLPSWWRTAELHTSGRVVETIFDYFEGDLSTLYDISSAFGKGKHFSNTFAKTFDIDPKRKSLPTTFKEKIDSLPPLLSVVDPNELLSELKILGQQYRAYVNNIF